MIQTETAGRRTYLTGDTYACRDAIRSAGGHWDADRRAWWLGDRAKAETLAGALGSAPAAASAAPQAPGEDAVVAGRAIYHGRTYYLAGRIERGRTRYDDRVGDVTSRDGSRIMLVFRDGSRSFWASTGEVAVESRYDRPQTIARLRAYAERSRSSDAGCGCRCHTERNAGAPGSTLYDGCDRCGCEQP